MKFRSFQLVIGLGLGVLVAYGTPACGGDSEDDKPGTGGKDSGTDTGTGATGGSGGSGGSGGTGATGGSGGSGGSEGGTTITCVSESCTSYNLGGFFELPPCCAGASKDKCGVDVDDGLASQIGIKGGCFELNQPGNVDSNCPPLTGVPIVGSLPGCCNATAKKCSYQIDIAAFGGPNMGCVDPANVPSEGGPPKDCVPGQPGDGGSDAATEAGDAATDSASEAASDAASDAAGDAPTDTSTSG